MDDPHSSSFFAICARPLGALLTVAPVAARFLRRCAVAAVALALAGCNLQRNIADDPNIGKSDLTVAPPLSGATLGGGRFDLATHRGHLVVVDFWASWCGPCRRQQPDLDALAREFLPQGVSFVGVDMRDGGSGQAYIDDYHVPYPSLVDPDGGIAGSFDVPAPPETLIVSGDGHIVRRILGGITVGDLEPVLKRLVDSRSGLGTTRP